MADKTESFFAEAKLLNWDFSLSSFTLLRMSSLSIILLEALDEDSLELHDDSVFYFLLNSLLSPMLANSYGSNKQAG